VVPECVASSDKKVVVVVMVMMMMSTELEGMWEEVVQLPKQLFSETTVKNVARIYGCQAGI
jgi:hypothetical protein